jgi:hypothetical protein
MASLVIMDRTGDTRHQFNPSDAGAVSKAERRFQTLIKAGLPLRSGPPAGEITVTRTFEPTAEEMLFYPRLVGG